jgi:hypothetical protein
MLPVSFGRQARGLFDGVWNGLLEMWWKQGAECFCTTAAVRVGGYAVCASNPGSRVAGDYLCAT